METEPRQDGLNKLIWQGRCLTIPWVYIDRKKLDFRVNGFEHMPQKIIGVDNVNQYWIQVALFSLIDQAKKFIQGEIANDINSMQAWNAVTYLTAEGFVRYLHYGLLPTDVRGYLSRGYTHLGFGPAIDTLRSKPFYARNHLGIWRPCLVERG